MRLPGFLRRRTASSDEGRRWVVDSAELPWFEQPDALDRVPEIARRWACHDRLEGWLESWVRDGYFVAENFVPAELLAEIGNSLDSIWQADAPVPGLNVDDVIVDGEKIVHCPHARIVEKSAEERAEIERRSFWRIQGLHLFDERARRLYEFEGFRQVASAIFDRPAEAQFSLTFGKGSQQAMHQDTYVFHVWPMQFICGAWIACEDIHPDSGPLAYVPGSHRAPLFGGFDNYPQTQCRTAQPAELQAYGAYLDDAMAGLPRREFVARRGDVLFWHGMLAHGGSPVRDASLSRRSFVIHLLPSGASRAHEVVGPFNW